MHWPDDLATRRIDAPRVCLRLLLEADVAAVFALFSDPQMERFLSFRNWRNLDDAHAWYQKARDGVAARKLMQWMLVERCSGQVIGASRLFGIREEDGVAEIGYSLMPAYWGQGIMQEALRALLDELFGEFGLRRLEASTDVRNQPSQKLLATLGFALEGTRRECRVFKGELVDANVYGLLAHEWQAGRPQSHAGDLQTIQAPLHGKPA